MNGVVEGAAAIASTKDCLSLNVHSALPLTTGFRRRIEICEEVVGADEWDLPWEEDPVLVIMAACIRLVLAITESAVIEIGFEARSRRRLQVALR